MDEHVALTILHDILCNMTFCVIWRFVLYYVLCIMTFLCVIWCFVYHDVLCFFIFCVTQHFVSHDVLCYMIFCVSWRFVFFYILCNATFCISWRFVLYDILCYIVVNDARLWELEITLINKLKSYVSVMYVICDLILQSCFLCDLSVDHITFKIVV